ncbi:mas-related G-protein coupled receptor member H-like [Lissotriton helveticus]
MAARYKCKLEAIESQCTRCNQSTEERRGVPQIQTPARISREFPKSGRILLNIMADKVIQSFNQTFGISTNQTKFDFSLRLALSLPSQIICLLGLAGNGVVFWVLCFGMKRNPVTVYVLNLAVVDFSVLLCISLELFLVLFKASRIAIPPLILTSLKFLFTIGYNNSLYLLTAISVERCLSVVLPLWYKCHRPKHQSAIVCSLLWLLAFLVTIVEFFSCTVEEAKRLAPNCMAAMIFSVCLAFGVVYMLMIVSSVVLVVQVRRRSKKRQPMRLYRAILLNVLVFLVTSCPTRLIGVFSFFQVIQLNRLAIFLIYYGHRFFTTINSSANPCIYFLVGWTHTVKSRGLLKGALHRVFKPEQEMSSQSGTICSTISRSEIRRTGEIH